MAVAVAGGVVSGGAVGAGAGVVGGAVSGGAVVVVVGGAGKSGSLCLAGASCSTA